MDPISFTASLLTLIQGADFIRRTLGDIRKGGKDRERLLAEVKILKSALDRLKADDDKARENDRQEAWLDVVGHLSSKGGALECIDDVISEIRLKTEPKHSFRGMLMQWTWPFMKEDVDRNVRQMQRLSHSVSLALQDASLKLAMAMNKRITRLDKVANKNELRAILQWLSSLNFLEQQRLEFLKAMSGTCDWFLSSPLYIAWAQKQQRVLYCSAIGGAGKTILASVAVDNLRMQMAGQDVGIFIMYCKHDRLDTHSAEKLAMAMLRQLVQIKACQIPSDLEDLLEKHYYTSDTRPNMDEILKVINAHLPTFSASFIVLDGLDEIMQDKAREEIVTLLMKLEGEPRVMFTSRPIDVIEKTFHPTDSDRGIYEIESSDDENASADYWTEYEADDVYDLTPEGIDYENASGASSEQDDADMDPNLQTHPTSLTLDTSAIQSDNPSPPSPRSPLQQFEDVIICGRCRQKIASLQYKCQQCTGLQSIICKSCYEHGVRCVSEDNNHNNHVTMRLPCFKMDVSARPRAIRTYVRKRTKESPVLFNFAKLKPGFAEEIEEVVTEAAQKMFLLAQLHMDAISDPDLLKFSEVQNALLNLPTRLNDSYDKAIDRIQAHGRSLLRLVAYALRPLDIKEVEQALGMSPGADNILDEEIIPASTLVSRCAGLVTFDENHQVVFSHYTIVGYFAKRRDDLFGNGHKSLAITCLSYLSIEEFRKGPLRGEEEGGLFDARLTAYSFLEYASIFWGIHAKASEDDDVLEVACEFVKDDERRNASIQALWFSSDEVTGNWCSRSGASPLHLAMHFKYAKLANRLLEDGIDANIRDTFGMTSLMWAAQVGDEEMARKIIHMQVPLNAINSHGENALHLAINQRHEGIAILLIGEASLDVNAPAKAGRGAGDATPLMLAIEREEVNVVQKLLTRNDISVNAKDRRGWSAVHRAAIADDPRMMEALVAIPSVDLECRDEYGSPPLIKAAKNGILSATVALLDAGADVNIREGEVEARGNALMRAADYDYIAVVHELIKRGIDRNAKDNLNRSAVHSAAINGSTRSLAALLDLPQTDVNLQDVYGNTPTHDAAGFYDSRALEILLDKGAKSDIRNHRGKTPLDTARAKGRKMNVRLLKERYAEELGMPKRSLTGMSLEEPTLIQAAQQGDEAAVDSVLATYKQDKSIDIEERDDWLGRTPLQHAIDVGSFRIVKSLHNAGASIKVQDKMGRTAIHIAAMRHRFAIARYLLRNGVDLAVKDQWGVNVMEDAAPSLQVLLLQYGIEITKDQDLEQLLFFAAELGNMKAVQRLIDAGAEVQVKDRYGWSPYERAKQAGKMEVAKYLDRAGKSAAESSSHLPTPEIDSVSLHTLNATTASPPAISAGEDEAERDDRVNRGSGSQNEHDHQLGSGTANQSLGEGRQILLKNALPGGKEAIHLASSHLSLKEKSLGGGRQVIPLVWDWKYIVISFLALMLGLYLRCCQYERDVEASCFLIEK